MGLFMRQYGKVLVWLLLPMVAAGVWLGVRHAFDRADQALLAPVNGQIEEWLDQKPGAGEGRVLPVRTGRPFPRVRPLLPHRLLLPNRIGRPKGRCRLDGRRGPRKRPEKGRRGLRPRLPLLLRLAGLLSRAPAR
ncbi:hypothetical protein N6H14_22625 [Paenibacillus sp. CC-CFT747]|nr:hypothetical protein N6H14_22625 [Paenibacillus sp. CC-CFT747]